jgi:hypothetical protein
MRLSNVERGDCLSARLFYGVMRAVSGFRAPDVVRTLWYRPNFFGRPHSAHTHAVMRGPSEWSVGERELFAAFVSRLNTFGVSTTSTSSTSFSRKSTGSSVMSRPLSVKAHPAPSVANTPSSTRA